METKMYDYLPEDAKVVRTEVFIKEQGFVEEFDAIDNTAMHLVVYDKEQPIGTCRFFTKEDGAYWIGRLAVIKEYRSYGIGRLLVENAEKFIKEAGGLEVKLSAQTQAKGFYEKIGYIGEGEEYLEEHCPHITMKKCI